MNLSEEARKVVSMLRLDTFSNAKHPHAFVAYIEGGQLDRKLYLEVNTVLETLGGTWDRKVRGHLFDSNPKDRIEDVIETGTIETARDLGFFATPAPLVADLLERLSVKKGTRLLEPSAGDGAIAIAAHKMGAIVTAVEIDKGRWTKLCDAGLAYVHLGDFMDCKRLERHDVVAMNPPFGRRQDVTHVMHAFSNFLEVGGHLVSIMSAGITFREDALSKSFRNFVALHGGTIEPLPAKTFAESGTNVNTVLVTVQKKV